MKKLNIYLISCLALLSACGTRHKVANTSIANDGKAWAAIFQQRAAEYRALCFQAYNVAKLRIDEATKEANGKPLAVVTDIDETLLDNSPEGARAALNNEEFARRHGKNGLHKQLPILYLVHPTFLNMPQLKVLPFFTLPTAMKMNVPVR